jgi:hypothetical protein
MNERSATQQLWKHYHDAWSQLFRAKDLVFNQPKTELLAVIKYGLSIGERAAALDLMRLLKEEDLKLFFSEMLRLASSFNANTRAFHKLILTISKSWLVENIESYAEPIIAREDTHEEHMVLMELYMEIDTNLAVRLAERAINNSEEDIREWGIEMLEKLQSEDN